MAVIVAPSEELLFKCGLDGRIRDWSAYARRELGYGCQEVVGKPLDLLFCGPLPAALTHRLEELRAGASGTRPHLEVRLKTKAGTGIERRVSLSPLSGAEGPAVGVSLIGSEVLPENLGDEWLRLAVQAAPAAVVLCDESGKILSVNRETEQLLGYVRAELLGADIEVLVPEAFRAAHPGQRRRYCTDPRVRPMNAGRSLYARRKDGSLVPVEIGLKPVRTAQGLFILSSILDISRNKEAEGTIQHLSEDLELRVEERTQALTETNASLEGEIAWRSRVEAALRESESQFRQAVVKSPVPVMIYSEDGEVRMLSSTWTNLSGYAPEEIPTLEAWARLALGQDLPETGRAEFFLKLHAGEVSVRAKDGRELIWSCVTAPIGTLPDGRPLTKVVAMDVTCHKQMEFRLQRVTDDLRRSNADLEQFAYVASHDLRAPLRAISNLADWIAEDLAGRVPEETARHLRLLQQRVLRMDRMISDLLDYSRAGRVVGDLQQVRTEELVRETLELLSPSPAFSVVIGPGMPVLHTPPGPLRQIFANLIGNAIKHHHKGGGMIGISVRRLEGRYAFSVSDDGPGIAPEFHARIFQMFQVLQSRDRVEGSGMGLPTVKRIVESQGGQLSLLSAPGKGSVFTFTWPAQFDPSISAIRRAVVDELHRGNENTPSG